MLYSTPRIKIAALKIIESLIKLQLPFEIFEETIKIVTREKGSLLETIMNHTTPKVAVEGSLFLQFLFNYVISIRHKLWTVSEIESQGAYAVTQEVISLFRSIYECAP
jgi:hypothetical protein